jgi:hypothetical protein
MGFGALTNALFGSNEANKDRELKQAMFDFARQQYGEREPMRAMGLSRLRSPLPERPDQSAAFADPSNPFYSPPQALGFGGAADNRLPRLEQSLDGGRGGYSNQPPDLQDSLDDYRGVQTARKAADERVARGEFSERLPGGDALWGRMSDAEKADPDTTARMLGAMGGGGVAKLLKKRQAMGF